MDGVARRARRFGMGFVRVDEHKGKCLLRRNTMSRKAHITVKFEVDMIINMDEGTDIQQSLQNLDYDIAKGRDSKNDFDLESVEDVRVEDYEITDTK